MVQTWQEAQKFESDWHGNCVNSLNEELKQLVYAKKMGIKFTSDGKTPYNIDLHGQSVIDVGGGAYSLLLKASNFSHATVVEPLHHPKWVLERYDAHHIDFINEPAEEGMAGKPMPEELKFDEAWIYNCLQHVQDPEQIIANTRNMAKLIRIFEWIDLPVCPGHIHELKANKLDLWLQGQGKVEEVHELGCNGRAYYGIFPV